MFHRPGKGSKGPQSFLIFLALFCMGAKATAPTPPTEPAQARRKVREVLQLQPQRVVYRQVEATPLKSPHGVFVDVTTGEVYVADTKNDLVAVYDQSGVPLFAFGYNGEFKEPQKVVCDPRGRIYVLTGVPRQIKVFNYRGEYQHDFPFAGFDVEPEPNALMVDGQGNLYIADVASGQILVYDPEYRLKLAFGAKGDGSSHFQSVRAIALDREGNIYAADARATPAIQVFSPEGKYLRGWGEHASGPQNFSLPAGLAIDGEGRVIVVDTLRHTIVIFTNEGEYVGRYGGLGMQPGAVAFPTDIATNGEAKIYVVEREGRRLQILEEQVVVTRRGRGTRRAPDPLQEKVRRDAADFMRNMK